MKPYISGWCQTREHFRCAGGYERGTRAGGGKTLCTCTCHKEAIAK